MLRTVANRSMFRAFLLWTGMIAVSGAPLFSQAQAPPEPSASQASSPFNEEPANADAEATDSDEPADEKRVIDLSSPRATMREFLLAMQEALGDKPERIEDAVTCLDRSELSAENRDDQSRALARRLYTLIEREGVNLDDIPTETEENSFVFYAPEVDAPTGEAPRIELTRTDEGQWQFSAQTLASIPALEKRAEEKPKEEKPAATTVSAARRTPRATMKTFLEAMNAEPPDLESAANCLDPTGQSNQAWPVRSRDLAVKLKFVIDRIQLVVLSEIPDSPTGDPFVWHTSESGNIIIARIEEEGDLTGEWRFAPQTIEQIDTLYAAYEDKPRIRELEAAGAKEDLPWALRIRRAMPDWLRGEFFQIAGWQWLTLLALIVVGWFVQLIVTAITSWLTRAAFHRRQVEVERKQIRRPMWWFGAVACTVLWLVVVRNLSLRPEALSFLLPLLKILVAFSIGWFAYRLVDVFGAYIVSNKDIRITEFDELLIPLVRNILRIVAALVVLLIVLEWVTAKPPSTLLGALGVGGVALAFAAKDTLGNFFGSITVLLDRPFGLGDWIAIGDVEGTVEQVGFRSTRIRTFYNSLVTVPNSNMINDRVDNFGARRYRRLKTVLSLTYDTPPERIDAFCEGIRELIRLHPYTRKDFYHVYFNAFSASSLDVLVYMFLDTPDWGTELRERHRFFVDVLRLSKRIGVEFAFPTQTVWLERAAKDETGSATVPAPGEHSAETEGVLQAARVFDESYGPEPHGRGPVVIQTSPRSPQVRRGNGQ